MGESVNAGRFRKKRQRRMSEREKHEWIRLIWFTIVVTFVIHLAMLLDANKSFF
jgi:hypothetical protein